ncbi:MAG: PAS domain-containing protein [Thermoanaerobaculia bacterium]|nr:PAS domain-containing protein [Thermoanaerobaculia bacterium]
MTLDMASPSSGFQRVTAMSAGALAVFVGVTVLVGWALDLGALKSILPGWVSVKPNTALAFILTGMGLLFSFRPHSSLNLRPAAFVSRLVRLCALLAGLIGLLTLSEYAFGWNAGIDLWLFPEPAGTVGTSHPGRMAPDTALCFVLIASALELAGVARKTKRALVAAALLGSLVTTMALVEMLSYFSPALRTYGWGGLTMMALPTATLFAVLGVSLARIAWQESMSQIAASAMSIAEPRPRVGLAFLLVFFLLAAGIVSTGTFYYRDYGRHYRSEVGRQLSAIADLKVDQIVQWRKERLGDASLFFQNAQISSQMRRLLDRPEDADAQRQLLQWIVKFQEHSDTDRVRLLDVRGITRLSSPAGFPPVSAPKESAIAETLRSGQIMFQDFYRNDYDMKVYLGILVPIFDAQDAGRPLGVLALRINPESYLFPAIKRWPTPSPTAETLLVRRDGNDALFLSELRFQRNTTLNLRVPLDRTTMPAVQAALGREGVTDGVDYRGAKVVAATRTIPDSPWSLVARMDATEAYGPMVGELWQMIVMAGGLLLAAGGGVALVWRQQSLRFYRGEAAAAETLRASEERFRIASETANDVVYDWDLKQSVQWLGKVDEMLGYEPGAFPRTLDGWTASVHPDDLAHTIAAIQAHLEGHAPYDIEYRVRRKDGVYRWWWARGAAARTPEGTPVRWIGSITDITERKQAEADLVEAQNLRTEAEKLGKVGSWEFDTETKAMTWTEEVFHIHEVDLTYQPTVDAGVNFYAPASRPIIAQAVQRAIEQGEPFDVELEIVTAKGNRRYVHSIGRADPTRRTVLGFFQDITAQKHAEEEVRSLNAELEQRVHERTAQLETANADLRANRSLIEVIYRSQAQFIAADASQDMFDDLLDSLLDLTGSEYGFIDEMFYTPDGKPYLTARAITDISWNEQTRQMYAQFVSGELSFTKLESLFGAVMATGKPVIANNAPSDPRRGGVPPGHPALNAFLGLPLHSNNRFVGVIGLANRPGGYSEELIAHLEPVVQACASLLSAWRSERKREEAEAALVRKTAELETANKELEAFSYSVSHDLRAPLRAIDGYGRILLEDYESRLDPEGRRLLGVISGETRRMGQLIDDLLAFSQLSRRKLEASDIDMAAMARAVFDEQAGHAPQRVFRLELQPLPPAHGDPAMIRVALGNLLSNAIKFTKPRNPAVIEIGSRLEDGQAVYYVKDNGVGFDMRYAHKLFGVFQRLHSTEEFEGTGVGLALVQRVVHRHGGRVWADGKVDEGATFYFSLPDMREES